LAKLVLAGDLKEGDGVEASVNRDGGLVFKRLSTRPKGKGPGGFERHG